MVKAWQYNRWSLFRYSMAICNEWIKRGYKDTCKDKILDLMYDDMILTQNLAHPKWLTDEFCSRHRAALLMKNYEWYSQFGWSEVPEINYIYPVTK